MSTMPHCLRRRRGAAGGQPSRLSRLSRPAALATRTALAALAVPLLLAAGCASSSSISVRCDPRINDGLLLTVDLVQIADAEVPQIKQAGDQWFYSDLRRQLEPRTKTVAVTGGCSKEVQLEPRKGYDTLAVIADYKSAGSDTSRGSIQFVPKTEWRGKTLRLDVHDSALTIQGGR
jgi:hypothetical protein